MPQNNMPENWEPPAPAWESVWEDTSDPLVSSYFGIQSEKTTSLDAWAVEAFAPRNAPLSTEKASFVDATGETNHVHIAYWRLSQYKRWWDTHGHWWADSQRLGEGVGYWREVFEMPFKRFETLHSSGEAHGVGVSAQSMAGPIDEHGYPGGARDRIADSDTEDLTNSEIGSVKFTTQIDDNGRRVRLVPPKNLCVIRSGQDWSLCEGEERDYYLKNVHPVLIEGMQFLENNPVETNCFSMRLLAKRGDDWGDTEQSFGLGYATDIYAFENWAKSHPTHLAIFDSFMQMVQTFGEAMKLQLWHEVTVLPAENCEFEYLNCHASTGLLNYA